MDKPTAVILAILVLIQGYQLIGDIEETHYCESRELKMGCFRLSSTNKTCYNEDGGKRCTEGWKEIPTEPEITFSSSSSGKEYICPKRPGPCRIIKR